MQKVLIFGSGSLYKKKERYIKENYDIAGFLDNKVQVNETQYNEDGLPVYNPQNVMEYAQQDMLIVLMSYQYVAMWKQLQKLGVDRRKILFGFMFPPLAEEETVLFEQGRNLDIEGENVIYCISQDERAVVESHRQLLQQFAKKFLREKYRMTYPLINEIARMDTKPVSRKFGLERGTAIDRYFIEDFLQKNKELIYGDCLEIAENTYTLKYGEDRVKNSYILHLEGWGENAIKGNLETGEGIETDKYDSLIITQTLMFIFDVRKVAENIYKMLKRGGNALITVSGISQLSRYDADLWGSYYSFHEDAMRALFEPLFGKDNVKIQIYGNVKTTMAMLYGLCKEDLCEDDFQVVDYDYPQILAVILKKR